jgi:hypothetical protein
VIKNLAYVAKKKFHLHDPEYALNVSIYFREMDGTELMPIGGLNTKKM